MADFLATLRRVNAERLAAWEGDTKTDGLFHATELGGEVGEILNVVKKLHREAMGWRGSRATLGQLGEEIGDAVICLDKLADFYGLDIAQVTVSKFNATSERNGFPHRLAPEQNADMLDAARIAELEALVRICGEQFRFYEASHRAQAVSLADADPLFAERMRKADINRGLAERCEAANRG